MKRISLPVPESLNKALHRFREQPGRFPHAKRLVFRLLRIEYLLLVLLVVFSLALVSRYLTRSTAVNRNTVIYKEENGNRLPAGRLERGTRIRIERWDYGWYRVRATPSGPSGWIPGTALGIDNPWLEHFIPTVFSKNHQPNRIPFKKESHALGYSEQKGGRQRGGREYYFRLTIPILLLLAAAFSLGFSRTLVKTAASILFFSTLLVYSLFAAGELNKHNYGYVSYFKQVSLRIPYGHKGMVFTPNNTWLVRTRAFLGLRDNIVLSHRATPRTIQNAYLITDGKGYTPGWALQRARLVYANGPARLYYIPGP